LEKISTSNFSRESKVLLQAFPENQKSKIVMAQLTDSRIQIVVQIRSLNVQQKKKGYLSIFSSRKYLPHCRKFSVGSMRCVKINNNQKRTLNVKFSKFEFEVESLTFEALKCQNQKCVL
jgi:hypothetical protein